MGAKLIAFMSMISGIRGGCLSFWCCVQMALRQETKHRPMDLRVARSAFGEPAQEAAVFEGGASGAPWEVSLKIASHIAAEARAAVKVTDFAPNAITTSFPLLTISLVNCGGNVQRFCSR